MVKLLGSKCVSLRCETTKYAKKHESNFFNIIEIKDVNKIHSEGVIYSDIFQNTFPCM